MIAADDIGLALRAVERALGRDAHVLSRRPDLAWQQLHNRLQWESEPVSGLLQRGSRERRPWLRLRSRLPESSAFEQALVGHRKPVHGADFDATGTFLATAGQDGVLILWDPSSGTERARWSAASSFLTGCAFTPKRRIVTTAGDGTVMVWDVHGRVVRALEGHTEAVVGCHVAPDGRRVVTAGDDGSAIVWDLASGDQQAVLRAGPLPPATCAFSPDGRRVATGGLDGIVRLWDAGTGADLEVLRGHVGPITACGYGPDGRLVTAGADGTVRVWGPDAKEQAVAEGHEGRVLACAVSPDGAVVVSGGDDGLVRVWDVGSGDPLAALRGHSGGVLGCALSADGSMIVSASQDTTARLWAMPEAGAGAEPAGHRERVSACVVFDERGIAVSTGDDGSLRYWSLDSLEPEAEITVGTRLRSCTATSDGAAVAAGGADEAIRLWDTDTAQLLIEHDWRRENMPIGSIDACALSADGGLLAASVQSIICVLDTSTGDERHRLERRRDLGPSAATNIRPMALTFLPDGNLLAAYQDGCLVLWTLPAETDRVIGTHDVLLEACAAGGEACASSDEEGRVCVWDGLNGERLFDAVLHDGWARACALSADGSLVASGGYDRLVRVHEVRSGREIAALPTAGWVTALAFHRGGWSILAGDQGGALYAADLEGFTPRS